MGRRSKLCRTKNKHEQSETGFAKARISNVVVETEQHDSDSLSKHVSHVGGQKWEDFREAMQKQVARVQHHLEAQTKK